jgi:hypothetical protein
MMTSGRGARSESPADDYLSGFAVLDPSSRLSLVSRIVAVGWLIGWCATRASTWICRLLGSRGWQAFGRFAPSSRSRRDVRGLGRNSTSRSPMAHRLGTVIDARQVQLHQGEPSSQWAAR